MHFLEKRLFEHPLELYAVAIGLYAFNLALYFHVERKRASLTVITSTPAMTPRQRLSRSLLATALFLAPGLFLQGEYRYVFTGAYVVMQLASLAQTLLFLQNLNTMLVPGAVTGHVDYSKAAQARFTAASNSALAVFGFAAFLFTGSPSIFAASFYIALTSFGFRRRARRYAARETPLAEPGEEPLQP